MTSPMRWLFPVILVLIPGGCGKKTDQGSRRASRAKPAPPKTHAFRITHMGEKDVAKGLAMAITVPGSWEQRTQGADNVIYRPPGLPESAVMTEASIMLFHCRTKTEGNKGCLRRLAARQFDEKKIASGVVRREALGPDRAWYFDTDSSKGKRLEGRMYLVDRKRGVAAQCMFIVMGDLIARYEKPLRRACQSLAFAK